MCVRIWGEWCRSGGRKALEFLSGGFYFLSEKRTRINYDRCEQGIQGWRGENGYKVFCRVGKGPEMGKGIQKNYQGH